MTTPAAPTVQQAIDALYITLYNRTADSYGLTGWASYLGYTPAQAASTTATLAQFQSLAAEMIAVESTTTANYYTQQYGGASPQQFITDLYLNLGGASNQAGIQAGVSYWTSLIVADEAAGQTQTQAYANVLGQFVQTFLTYNTTGDVAGTARQDTLLNKDTVSDAYIAASANHPFMVATTTTSAAFQAEIALVANVTSTQASVQSALNEINAVVTAGNLNPILNVNPATLAPTFTLTPQPDAPTLTGSYNVIAGTIGFGGTPTFSTGDQIIITGGGTGNVINLTDNNSTPGGYTINPTATAGVTVSGVQTADFTANGALNLNTSATGTQGWTGLTALNVISYSAGVNVDTFTVAPTTAVTVNDTNFAQVTAGLTVNGGSNVSINEANLNNNNSAQTIAVLNVSGPTVSVVQTVQSAAGQDQKVSITDVNYNAHAAAGTVTTVTLDGLPGALSSTIQDSGLTNLTINNAANAHVFINNGGFTTGATTLNLTLNFDPNLLLSDTSGTSAYTSLAITTGATGSSVDEGFANVTSETVAGSSLLQQADAAGGHIASIAISGAAGFTDLGLNTSATLTSVTTSSSGAVTVVLNAAQTSFVSTGSGQDYVTIGQDATKAITGGSATDNEIVLNAAATVFTAADSGVNVTGFQIIGTGANSSGDYVLTGAGAILAKDTALTEIDVTANSTGALTFSQVAVGTTLSVDASDTQAITYQTIDSSGPTDSVAVTLGSGANLSSAAGLTLEDSIFQGIGTVTFNTTGSTFAQITQLNDSNLTQLTISGAGVDIHTLKDAGTTLTVTDSSNNSFGFGDVAINAPNLTTLSFSETGSGTLTVGPGGGAFTEANLTSLTLKGAVGTNQLMDNATNFTLVGGTDNANVSLGLNGGGTDSITLGNGNNIILAPNATQDTINVGSGANVVSVGNGIPGSSYTASITFAAHTNNSDTVFLGATGGSSVHIATITGLNSSATGSDSIDFTGDATLQGITWVGNATGVVTAVSTTLVGAYAQALNLDPTQLNTWVAATLDTTHGGAGLAQHHIASFQFQGNTYVLEQAQATGVALGGNAFGSIDTIVELTGLVNVTSNSTVTAGVLHLLG
jgi:hypothetical protein